MEAIKIKRKITSDRLPELNKFKGQDVEILITQKEEFQKKGNAKKLLKLKGCLKSNIDGMEFQRKIRKEWDRDELSS